MRRASIQRGKRKKTSANSVGLLVPKQPKNLSRNRLLKDKQTHQIIPTE